MNLSPSTWIEAIEKYLGQTKGWLAMHERVKAMEARIAILERANQPSIASLVCDHCGSPDLKRTGSRPSRGPFGALGQKDALYDCNACGKQTALEIPMK